MRPEVRRYPNLERLGLAAASLVVDLAEASLRKRGRFTLVLSGGTTPRVLYERLAGPPFSERMPWGKTYLFWGDERCVAPDHPHSNFGMAYQALLSKVPLPAANVYRIPGEVLPPEAAAVHYEERLREFFHARRSSGGSQAFPVFDLLLLGLGPDGHTASLFPGDSALEERQRWVRAVEVSPTSPQVPRITLTLPVINSALNVLLLVSGPGKEKVLEAILSDREQAALTYPAARVKPAGPLFWLIDEERTR